MSEPKYVNLDTVSIACLNTKKTKIIRMSTVEGRTMKITVNGQNLERVHFVTSEVW